MLDIDRDNFFGNIRILEDDIPSNEYYQEMYDIVRNHQSFKLVHVIE